MLTKCPCCGEALEYHKVIIKEEFYVVKSNGEISKKPKRKQFNKEWSQLESGLSCTKCSFTTIPTQTTDYFQMMIERSEVRADEETRKN